MSWKLIYIWKIANTFVNGAIDTVTEQVFIFSAWKVNDEKHLVEVLYMYFTLIFAVKLCSKLLKYVTIICDNHFVHLLFAFNYRCKIFACTVCKNNKDAAQAIEYLWLQDIVSWKNSIITVFGGNNRSHNSGNSFYTILVLRLSGTNSSSVL